MLLLHCILPVIRYSLTPDTHLSNYCYSLQMPAGCHPSQHNGIKFPVLRVLPDVLPAPESAINGWLPYLLYTCFRTTCSKVIILNPKVMRFCYNLFYFRLNMVNSPSISKHFIFSGNIIASGFQTPKHIGSWCIADCIKIIIRILWEIFCMVGR